MRHSQGRVEDQRLLTGEGRFVANLAPSLAPGAAVVWFVRSAMAHARLVSVDVVEAPHDRIGTRLIDTYLSIKRKGAIG